MLKPFLIISFMFFQPPPTVAETSITIEKLANAEKDSVWDQYEIAQAFRKAKNYTEAAKWYSKAAEQGHPLSQEKLAHLYKDGKGIQQDWHKAAQLYQSVAKQAGEEATKSQVMLGQIYAAGGHGIDQNWQEAHFWYSLAIANNYNPSNAWPRQQRDEIEKHLTPEQISITQQRVQDWKPEPQKNFPKKSENLSKPSHSFVRHELKVDPRFKAEQLKRFKDKAEKGDAFAQKYMAQSFLLSNPPNWPEVYFWSALAEQKSPSKTTSQMKTKAIENLTPDQLETLKKRVMEWKPKPDTIP